MGHVWLVGMMGVGKTTVGALVAERMERPLVDSDGFVMERTNQTIPELFSKGEEVFRSAERAAIVEIAAMADGVVSTGGGVVLDDENVRVMRSSGTIVLLEADTDALIERLSGFDDRPLATDTETIADIATARTARYRDVADHVVDTNARQPDEVAAEVMLWLNI